MTANDYMVALIRTLVPAGVGALTTLLLRVGVDFGAASESVTVLAVVFFTGAYYAAVRALARRWPKAGWLLGNWKVPVYVTPGQGYTVGDGDAYRYRAAGTTGSGALTVTYTPPGVTVTPGSSVAGATDGHWTSDPEP